MTNTDNKPLDLETCKTLIKLFIEAHPELIDWVIGIEIGASPKPKKQVQVMTEYVPERHKNNITVGKWYDYTPTSDTAGFIFSDLGSELFIRPSDCAFLDEGIWQTRGIKL